MATLFGIALNPSASKLHAYVENHFGQPILEEEAHDWPQEAQGKSTVGPDGTPVITVNAATGTTESTVVHELFHLYLRTEGFPILEVQGGNAVTKQFLGALLDSIEHSIFYPTMRQQCLDPDLRLRDDCQEALAENGCLSGFDLHQRAAWYFSVALETENQNLKLAIDQWFEQNDAEALARGRRMVAARFEGGQLLSAANAVQVLVECSSICFEPSFTFQTADWCFWTMGRHIQHIATIAIQSV